MCISKISVDIKDIKGDRDYSIKEIVKDLHDSTQEIAKEFQNNELKDVKKEEIVSLKICSNGKIEIEFEKK